MKTPFIPSRLIPLGVSVEVWADADINFREEVRAQLAALKGSLKVASRT